MSAPAARTTLPIATRRRAFARLGPLLQARTRWIVVLVVAGIANATAGLVGPWAIGRLVDELPRGGGTEVVWQCAIAVAAAGIVMALGTWIGAWALARIAMPVVAQLRTEVVESALALDAQQVERTGTGDLVSRVADDSRMISEAAAQVLPLIVESLLVVIVTGVGMAAIDWRLGIVGLVALPMYWLTLRWYLPRSEPIYKEQRAAFGRRAGRLLGGLTGAQTLRAYRAEAGELGRIDAASGQARDLSIGVFRFLTRAFGRNNRAEAVVLSLILITGFALVWFGESTAGAVTTAALLFHRLFNPIGALVGLFDQVQSAGASLTRMVGVIIEAENAPRREAERDRAGAARLLSDARSAQSVQSVQSAQSAHRAPGAQAERREQREQTAQTAGSAASAEDAGLKGVAGSGELAGSRELRPALVLENLWFSYDADSRSDNHVLRGVSLRVEPGEVVAVVGTTGAGKSTLARIAAGLSTPTHGRAELVIPETGGNPGGDADTDAGIGTATGDNPVADTDAGTDADDNSDADTDAGTDAGPDIGSNPDADTSADAGTDTGDNPGSNPDPDAGTGTGPDTADTNAGADAGPDLNAGAVAGPDLNAGAVAGPDTDADTGADAEVGVPLGSLPESVLRSHIAMIAQEVHTFAGTVRDNVALPVPDAGDDEIASALHAVGATWAFELPDGLSTEVGDGGMRLSLIQQQSLALARLVLADPGFAILDEATAEAGSAGAHVLERSARAALAGRGALVIAHRLSQAETADRVLVMEHGRIVEEGRHAELVALGGRYARLWEAWSA